MLDGVDVTLAGKTYTIRPTFDALTEIERKCGRGIIQLIRGLTSDDIRIGDIAIVIHTGIVASGQSIDIGSVGSAIVEEGFTNFIGTVSQFLNAALAAGPEEPVEAGSDKSEAKQG